LTNGIIWKFYSPNESTKEFKLFETPFLILDFSDLNDELFETLSKFHKNNIDLKEINEEAQEFFFLQGFSDAFANELLEPSDDLIKAIFNRMEGKRMTDTIKDKIRNLINSNSIKNALDKVMEAESRNGNIIITTAEELKIYHAVKTVLLQNIKKIDSIRISYRDQKNSFNILVDDNNKKLIAKVTSTKNQYFIEIAGTKYNVNGLESIVGLKKQLVEITQPFFS
jgi:hypothetical protein